MKQVTLRYPPAEVHDRADRLSAVLNDDEGFRALTITRSKVLLMALLEGLDALEQRYENELAAAAKE